MKSKLSNLFKVNELCCSSSMSLLILRLVAGTAFAIHGWGKIQHAFDWMGPTAPVPGFFQFLAAFSEFGGGIAWILGALMPLASLGLAFTMLVAVLTHMVMMKDPFIDPAGGHSYELASVYFAIAMVLGLVGPGKLSVDAKIFGNK